MAGQIWTVRTKSGPGPVSRSPALADPYGEASGLDPRRDPQRCPFTDRCHCASNRCTKQFARNCGINQSGDPTAAAH